MAAASSTFAKTASAAASIELLFAALALSLLVWVSDGGSLGISDPK
jgi:hypothetical protein